MAFSMYHNYYRNGFFEDPRMRVQRPSFGEIRNCFVRKDHPCGKFLSVSKSCFVACPSDEDIQPIIDLISEKLTRHGVEPIIAVRERVYGQDIFCTKICGKIIESQFCLVILDDSKKSDSALLFPSPNVYYEYGLMTALGKHVIPLQKQSQDLAFNIQTHDTIKYTSVNLSSELDRAIKDTVKIIQQERTQPDTSPLSRRSVFRSLELGGYKEKEDWFLDDDIDDTAFRGCEDSDNNQCIIVNISNNKDNLENAISDLPVIIKRLDTKYNTMLVRTDTLSTRLEALNTEKEQAEKSEAKKATPIRRLSPFNLSRLNERIAKTSDDINEASRDLERIRNTSFAFVLFQDAIQYKEALLKRHASFEILTLEFPLYIGDSNGIQIGDKSISFQHTELSA